ncbi:MAG: thiazole synthase [Candidatus Brocadiia bacterium]
MDKKLKIGKYEFNSRMFVGTGKYATFPLMKEALEASGTDCVTVAVRRVNLKSALSGNKDSESLLDYIDTKKYKILPNTAGCYSVDEAVRTARLGREVGLSDMVKIEVIGDEKTLYPDLMGLIEATKILVKEGFTVLPYSSDDLITALRLEDAGAACVMPLGAPIGSGLGIVNPMNIQIIISRLKVPVIVDAGVGTASDVAVAMELGADGVLLNTGIALAKDPVKMARAMKLACEAGRESFLAGRIPKKYFEASASSPKDGKISQ